MTRLPVLLLVVLVGVSVLASIPSSSAVPVNPKVVAFNKTLIALRAACAAQGATKVFAAMDTSGFTKILLNASASVRTSFTFLAVSDAVWARNAAYINKLTNYKMLQLLGYSVLTGYYKNARLVALPTRFQFSTGDYSFRLQKLSAAKAPRVSFCRPAAKKPAATVIAGDVYVSSFVLGHVINGLLVPPKFV